MKESIVKAVKEMIEAPSCCPELETAGEVWLESLGTDAEISATKALIAEAKADICTIMFMSCLYLMKARRCLVRIRQRSLQSMQKK